MTTRPVQEQFVEDEDNQWTLGSLMITTRMESLSASIVTSIDIWQKSTDWKRRNKKHECVLNATRRDILPKIAKGNRQ